MKKQIFILFLSLCAGLLPVFMCRPMDQRKNAFPPSLETSVTIPQDVLDSRELFYAILLLDKHAVAGTHLRALLQDPISIKNIIHVLANRFYVSCEEVAKALKTIGAQRYLDINYEWMKDPTTPPGIRGNEFLWDNIHQRIRDIDTLLAQGADINFSADKLIKGNMLKSDQKKVEPVLLLFPMATQRYEVYARVIEYLLNKGADPYFIGEHGHTILHKVIVLPNCGFPVRNDILRVLLAKNLSHDFLNKGNARGRTAMFLAAEDQNWDAVNMLLKAGASPSIKDEDGIGVLDQVQMWSELNPGKEEITELPKKLKKLPQE